MSDLLAKLKKNSTVKHAEVLENSVLLLEKDMATTPYPAINIALGGSVNGGLTSGITIFAGKSKHFKTLFSLILAEAYLKKHPDSILLFYDSEFGSPIAYFESVGIDPSRVLHTPISTVEELKIDVSNQLNAIERGEKVVIVIDSIGNLASSKEVKDAIDGKEVADMTRAKALKSVFRIITPQLSIKDIPVIAISHTYDTQEMFSKQVVSGGTGAYYSGQNIYIIGRQQEKDGAEISGYKYIINVEKSRFTKEKSKIPVVVSFDGGINKYSGLLDIAIELGHVVKPKQGWYARCNKETGEISDKSLRESQTNTPEFWDPILSDPIFIRDVEDRFQYNRSLTGKEAEIEVASEVEDYLDTEDEKETYDDSPEV